MGHQAGFRPGRRPRLAQAAGRRGQAGEPAEGQGKISYYSAENIVEAKVLKRLSQSGISLSAFSAILRKLRKTQETLDPFKTIHKDAIYALCVRDNAEKVSIIYYDKRWEKHPLPKDLREDFSSLVIINLKEIMEEVRAALS